jgi:hypothetical protein
MSHAFLNATDLAIMMGSHYGTQFVGQTYLILGSSDALGNPVKFFKTLGEGVWDFLYLPVRIQTTLVILDMTMLSKNR